MKQENASRIVGSFENALNEHGYGFQYAVLRLAEKLAGSGKSLWGTSVTEFPVEVQKSGTRIDFVLQHRQRSIYLLAECKRANPSLHDWCFVKSSFVPYVEAARTAFIEGLDRSSDGIISTRIEILAHSNDIYHVAAEVKGKTPGDRGGQGRGAVEEAASQVCRGSNGMIDFFSKHPNFFAGLQGDVRFIGFLPVIFTTARLWISKVDLGSADLASGKINLKEVGCEEKPWLFYHYNQSPALKHSLNPSVDSRTLEAILYNEYVRTIAIVSASGIRDFLCSSMFSY